MLDDCFFIKRDGHQTREREERKVKENERAAEKSCWSEAMERILFVYIFFPLGLYLQHCSSIAVVKGERERERVDGLS